MNAKFTNHGNVYLLPNANQIHDNSGDANSTMDDVPDFGVCKSNKASVNAEEKSVEIDFLEDVFGFMIKAYENVQKNNQADFTDYSLDPYIIDSIKSMAKETLAEDEGLGSMYDTVFDIVKYSIRIIYMSDDCSVVSGSDFHEAIEQDVLKYINRKKANRDKFLDECVEYGIWS